MGAKFDCTDQPINLDLVHDILPDMIWLKIFSGVLWGEDLVEVLIFGHYFLKQSCVSLFIFQKGFPGGWFM